MKESECFNAVLPEIVKVEFEISTEDALNSVSIICGLLERLPFISMPDLKESDRLGYISVLARIANQTVTGIQNSIAIKQAEE